MVNFCIQVLFFLQNALYSLIGEKELKVVSKKIQRIV